MAEFFEIDTPRQMLEKARREFEKLEENLDSDSIFNFFVTAYHMCDYVAAALPNTDMESIYSNPDFKMCQYICNKSKHRTLKRNDSKFITRRCPAARFGEAVFGESVFDGERAYFITDDEEEVDVIELVRRVISLWETFLDEHSL